MAAKYIAHGAVETLLSVEIDSLADGGNKITPSALSNDDVTERYLMGNFKLSLGATALRTGRFVDMFILPEIDGDFATGSDSIDSEQKNHAGTFSFDLSTNAREDIISDVRLPNADFKVLLVNNIGVSFSAASNSLKLERNGYEDV